MKKRQIKNDVYPTVFEEKEVRRVWHDEQWYFSVIDVVAVLSQGNRPRKYWDDLKRKLREEGSELSDKIGQLKMRLSDDRLKMAVLEIKKL